MELLINNGVDELNLSSGLVKDLEDAVHAALRVEGLGSDYEVSLSFVSPETIRDLNKEYRGIDAVTDVLSFPMSEEAGQYDKMLGDIVICYDRAAEQAHELGHPVRREVVYLTVHSMFHLLGYDHIEPSDKKLMRGKEKEVIKILGIFKSQAVKEKAKKSFPIISGLNYAVEGLIYAVKSEYNMRVHIVVAIAVLTGAWYFDTTRQQLAILALTITMVMMAELINTAIEYTVNLVTEEYSLSAKIAKDVAAAAVLVAAANSAIVGYLLLIDRVLPLSQNVFTKIRRSPTHLVFIVVVLIMLITVLIKSFVYKKGGSVFSGGSISGHASLSFAIATIIGFMTNNTIVVILAYILAFLVAQSRVEGGIHRWTEIIMGGMLGVSLTVLLMKLVMGG